MGLKVTTEGLFILVHFILTDLSYFACLVELIVHIITTLTLLFT